MRGMGNCTGISKTDRSNVVGNKVQNEFKAAKKKILFALEFRFEAHYFVTPSHLTCNKPSLIHIDVNQSNL